jgi:perosamine synthetase
MERIEELIGRKRWMAAAYTERLRDLDGIRLPVQELWARNVYWMYGIVLDESTGLDAAELARRLREAGVETRPFFLGMHEQPVLLAKGYFRGERYPIAERLARYGLYLPSGMTLTETQIEEVCEAVWAILDPGKDHSR